MLYDDCGVLIGALNTLVESHSIMIPYRVPNKVYTNKPKILSGKKPMETDKETIRPSIAP